jgi:hypothetical protein
VPPTMLRARREFAPTAEAEIAAWAGAERCHVRDWKRWGHISMAWHWRMMIRLTELGMLV